MKDDKKEKRWKRFKADVGKMSERQGRTHSYGLVRAHIYIYKKEGGGGGAGRDGQHDRDRGDGSG